MMQAKIYKCNSIFLVRKIGLGKGVVRLSLVVTEESRAGGTRW